MFISRWRFFLACLMLVVLPLQGIAATFRPACHAATAPAQPMQVKHSHHEDISAHEHAGDMHTDHAVDAHAQHASSAAASADQCNACSPCCASALISPCAVLVLPDFVRPHDFFLPTSNHASPPLAGLDRPPRNLAA